MYPPMYNTIQQQPQQPYANPSESTYILQPQAYTQAPWQNAPTSNPILRAILQLVEKMNQMNSLMKEI